jgi:hypothetical protein
MKRIGWVGFSLLLIAGIVFFILHSRQPSSNNIQTNSVGQLIYSSTEYGFSFSYPTEYAIAERTDNPTHTIILSRKDDFVPKDSEGPPVIVVEIISNPSSTALLDWLAQNSNYSNYAYPYLLGPATTTTVGTTATPAVIYNWGGEIYGENLVFEHNGNVVIFTGEYNQPSDPIKKDFDALIKTITIK